MSRNPRAIEGGVYGDCSQIPNRITAEWLAERYACRGEAKRFRRVFPHGAALTRANVRTALQKRMNVYWVAGGLFGGAAWQIFWRLWNEGDATTAAGRRREQENAFMAALWYVKTGRWPKGVKSGDI